MTGKNEYHDIKEQIIGVLSQGNNDNFEEYADEATSLYNNGLMNAEDFHDIIMLVKSTLPVT